MTPQYQQMTLDFVQVDDDSNEAATHTRAVLIDDTAGDLTQVLTAVTNFLRAAGFTYVGQIAVFNTGSNSDVPDTFGPLID